MIYPPGGYIVVDCLQRRSSSEQVNIQIVLDYITDVPLANLTVYGSPYVTPDSRHIITVDKVKGDVRVADVLDNGEFSHPY